MKKVWQLILVLGFAITVCIAQDVVSVVHGTVTKVDKATKTVVVKTADGTEHTINVTADTAYKGTKEGFDGLKEGTEVVARTTGTPSNWSCGHTLRPRTGRSSLPFARTFC